MGQNGILPPIISFETERKNKISLIPYYFKESNLQILRDGITKSLQKAEELGIQELNMTVIDFKPVSDGDGMSQSYYKKHYFFSVFQSLEDYFYNRDTCIEVINIS